ncbi:MAG: hypothetical protein ABJN26_00025 [Stappiaceae bacterium]
MMSLSELSGNLDETLIYLPLTQVKKRAAVSSQKIMQELFGEDIRNARSTRSESRQEMVKQILEELEAGSLGNPNKEDDDEENKKLQLKNSLIRLWQNSSVRNVDDVEMIIAGVFAVMDGMETAGYTDEEVEEYLSYFLEPQE